MVLTINSIYTKIILAGLFFSALFIICAGSSNADALSNAKNTISTSRPSASTPLSANAAAATQVSVFDNKSRFLASDSAKLIETSTGKIADAATNVASQSSALTTVYFSEALTGAAGAEVLYVPITAMHTVQFSTTSYALTLNDDIVLTFPALSTGDANNAASPSASTFQFNSVVAGTGGRDNVKVFDDAGEITAGVTITQTAPSAGNGGKININIDAGAGTIAIGSVIKIYLGCSSATSASCSTQVPRIINPTKTAAAGTADSWKVNIDVQESAASNASRDIATVAIGTIESVTIRATVDPTLSFTLTGIANATAMNTGNSGCSDNETTNSGIASEVNDVNLGILANTPGADTKVGNISAQRINISTNGANGFALTATASSSLLAPETGFFLNANTTSASFPSDSTDFFGLHVCGNDVDTSWVEGTPGGGADCDTHISGSAATECEYAWPSVNASPSTSALSIASDTVGPIGSGTGETGDGIISISYAAGTDATVPPGSYRSIITYVATPAF